MRHRLHVLVAEIPQQPFFMSVVEEEAEGGHNGLLSNNTCRPQRADGRVDPVALSCDCFVQRHVRLIKCTIIKRVVVGTSAILESASSLMDSNTLRAVRVKCFLYVVSVSRLHSMTK